MKTALWIGFGVLVVVSLVLFGLTAGWALWGQRLWAPGSTAFATGVMRGRTDGPYGGQGVAPGPGMMARRSVTSGRCAAWGEEARTAQGAPLSIHEAEEAVEGYLAARGQAHLEVAEVMEFERNFYAIVREPDTGVGAMELLIDKDTGSVGPEMGPNMMWNARYGMHRRGRMMGGDDDANAILPEEALTIANRWLERSRPGVRADEHVDPFYGYYTIHTLRDGEIEGMLSVHGTTGQVWYHTWHGPFIQMIETDEAH